MCVYVCGRVWADCVSGDPYSAFSTFPSILIVCDCVIVFVHCTLCKKPFSANSADFHIFTGDEGSRVVL